MGVCACVCTIAQCTNTATIQYYTIQQKTYTHTRHSRTLDCFVSRRLSNAPTLFTRACVLEIGYRQTARQFIALATLWLNGLRGRHLHRASYLSCTEKYYIVAHLSAHINMHVGLPASLESTNQYLCNKFQHFENNGTGF